MSKSASLRTAFLSDLHLGIPGNREKISRLGTALNTLQVREIVIQGDFFEEWTLGHLSHSVQWPEENTKFLNFLMDSCRKGKRLTLLAGNHDPMIRHPDLPDDWQYGNLRVVKDFFPHTLADGRCAMVTHGDLPESKYDWDYSLKQNPIGLALIEAIYYPLMALYYLGLRIPPARHAIYKAKMHERLHSPSHSTGFMESMASKAREHAFNAVICGHSHHGAIRKINEVDYFNSGDAVECLRFLGEDWNGKMGLLTVSHDGHIKVVTRKNGSQICESGFDLFSQPNEIISAAKPLENAAATNQEAAVLLSKIFGNMVRQISPLSWGNRRRAASAIASFFECLTCQEPQPYVIRNPNKNNADAREALVT